MFFFYKEPVENAKEPLPYDKIPDRYFLEKKFSEDKCNYEFASQN